MQTIVIFLSVANQVERIGFTRMAEYFREEGYTVKFIDFTAKENVIEQLSALQNENIYFFLGSNGLGTNIPLNNGKYLFEILDTLYISYLTDAPYNPYTSLMKYPCNKQAVLCLDRSHLDCLEKNYAPKSFAGKIFLPWGGYSEISYEEVFSSKRDIDVIFSARFFDSLPDRKWRSYGINLSVIKLLDEIADYLEARPVTVNDAVNYILNKHGIYDSQLIDKLIPFYKDLFMYIKTWRRIKSLEFLLKNDIRVDVYGDGWEAAPFADKIIQHGRVGYQEMVQAMSRAKVVYQDQAEFNNGGHDRVFTAMLNGAAVVSEYSSYLAEEFVAGQDLYMYDWQNGEQQVKVIKELLADEPRRQAMAMSAYSKADKKHRWKNRAERILELAALHYLKV